MPRIVVFVTLRALAKNDYPHGPLRSDDDGKVVVTKGQIEATIARTMRLFPMDYCSTLEECAEDISILAPSRDGLMQQLERLEETFREFAPRLRTASADCLNDPHRDARWSVRPAEQIVLAWPFTDVE